MSELSPVYSEYEKVSSLFRQLNDATLAARQTLLGINPPSNQEEEEIRHQLDEALEKIVESAEDNIPEKDGLEFSLSDVLEQVHDENEIPIHDLPKIRQRIRGKQGLKALTEGDIDTIEKITEALDSASEILFRRIQK